MIKYISQSGTRIEVGDFYGGGLDEVVTSLEELDNKTHLRVNTTLSYYDIFLNIGDYLVLGDGSGKIIKNKHDNDDI